MEKVKLSPPWDTFVHEIYALFDEDPDVSILFDRDEMEVKLYVESQKKADALMQLLPTEKEFGNVMLKITVVPVDVLGDSIEDLVTAAFEGNPVLSEIRSITSLLGSFSYAVFRKEVVQFYNDQLDDIHGNKSMLYQEIAKDVLGQQEGIFYCTDVE